MRTRIVLLAVALLASLAPIAIGLECPFHALTGLPCTACGGTRAMIALFDLDVRTALSMNPLVTLATLGAPLFIALALFARDVLAPSRSMAVLSITAILANWTYLIAVGR
jgi:hypothetical protein